jgi:hypothetical protein
VLHGANGQAEKYPRSFVFDAEKGNAVQIARPTRINARPSSPVAFVFSNTSVV